MRRIHSWFALMAAVLFGASVPAAKFAGQDVGPFMLAGLLYLGSGTGLAIWILARKATRIDSPLRFRLKDKRETWYLAGAIFFGGIVAPTLLMAGLRRTYSSTASLFLNLETAFTVALACLAFKETYGRRLLIGFAFLLSGGGFLALSTQSHLGGTWIGILAIVGACLCWGIDNNLTKQVTSLDATVLASLKGVVAGTVNTGLAYALGQKLPAIESTLPLMAIGSLGYGLSLVLFIVSLRKIGAARTSAYFSIAPFAGAVISLFLLNEPFTWSMGVAGLLMAIGVYLHLTENHTHAHSHEFMEHVHEHVHDAHHQHAHLPSEAGALRHSHLHRHPPLVHAHAHEHDDMHHFHSH